MEAPQELLSDTEAEINKRKSPRNGVSSALFNAVMAAPALRVSKIMDKWVEGNNVTRVEVASAMLNFRKRRMYGKALQVIYCFKLDLISYLNFDAFIGFTIRVLK